jgi:hypothetical protein
MKNYIKIIFMFMVVVIINSCETLPPEPEPDKVLPVNLSLEEVKKSGLEAAKNRLEELKKNFIYKEDEFKKIGWYSHKNQPVWKMFDTYLKTPVNSEWGIYLISHYYGDKWIFHNKVLIKIDDIVVETPEISLNSKDHQAEVLKSGYIREINHYRKIKEVQNIIKLIAENFNKEIKVRFVGKYYKDITLSYRDRLAIRDSYELSELIKFIKQEENKMKQKYK